MNTERKVMVFACGMMIVTFCACIIAAGCFLVGDHPQYAFPCVLGAVLSYWLGTSLADTLKDTQ